MNTFFPTNAEIKNILAQKLADEGCYFKKSDIKVESKISAKWIVINDYEHIKFKLHVEQDEYFGNIVWIDHYERVDDDKYEFIDNIVFVDSKHSFKFDTAIIQLGYFIGSRF